MAACKHSHVPLAAVQLQGKDLKRLEAGASIFVSNQVRTHMEHTTIKVRSSSPRGQSGGQPRTQPSEGRHGSPLAHATHNPRLCPRRRPQEVPLFLRDIAFFAPMDMESKELPRHSKVVSGRAVNHHYVRLIVLFPSLMRPPTWLRAAYTQLEEKKVVHCSWGAQGTLEKFLIWMTNKQHYNNSQVMSIWYSNKVYGPMEDFVLYGADSKGEVRGPSFGQAFRSGGRGRSDRLCFCVRGYACTWVCARGSRSPPASTPPA